jgi:hypothetical protein
MNATNNVVWCMQVLGASRTQGGRACSRPYRPEGACPPQTIGRRPRKQVSNHSECKLTAALVRAGVREQFPPRAAARAGSKAELQSHPINGKSLRNATNPVCAMQVQDHDRGTHLGVPSGAWAQEQTKLGYTPDLRGSRGKFHSSIHINPDMCLQVEPSMEHHSDSSRSEEPERQTHLITTGDRFPGVTFTGKF